MFSKSWRRFVQGIVSVFFLGRRFWSLNKKLSRYKFSNFSKTEAFWSHVCSHFRYSENLFTFQCFVGKTLITEVNVWSGWGIRIHTKSERQNGDLAPCEQWFKLREKAKRLFSNTKGCAVVFHGNVVDHEVWETNVERVVRRNLENLPSNSYTTCFPFGAWLKSACYRLEGVLSPSYAHNFAAQCDPCCY